MKYRVQVKEINYGSVIVDADSPEEALEKAKYPYDMGDIICSSGEHELSNPEKLPNSKMNCFLKKYAVKCGLVSNSSNSGRNHEMIVIPATIFLVPPKRTRKQRICCLRVIVLLFNLFLWTHNQYRTRL